MRMLFSRSESLLGFVSVKMNMFMRPGEPSGAMRNDSPNIKRTVLVKCLNVEADGSGTYQKKNKQTK
jgi:hypothetical protein